MLAAEQSAIVAEHPQHNIVHNRGHVSSARCPACGIAVRLDRTLDRYFHLDGSPNEPCWNQLLRGRRPRDTCPGHLRDFLDHVTDVTGMGLAGVWGLVSQGLHNQAEQRALGVLNGWWSRQMPDDCHDICARNGVVSTYYPYLWQRDCAYYACEFGHRWTCWWMIGQPEVGVCEENQGKAHDRVHFNLNDTISAAGGSR